MQPKKKPPQHIYSAFYSLHWGLWPLLFIIIQGNSEVFQSFNVSSMIVQEILLWKCLFQIINDKSCGRMVSSWPLRTSGSLVTYHRGPLPSSSCGKWRTFLPSSLQRLLPLRVVPPFTMNGGLYSSSSKYEVTLMYLFYYYQKPMSLDTQWIFKWTAPEEKSSIFHWCSTCILCCHCRRTQKFKAGS